MKLKICGTQHVMAFLAVFLELVHSWDVAVSLGSELRFYTNYTVTLTKTFESQNLTALTYYDVLNVLLYVNKQTNNDSICIYTINTNEYFCSEGTGRNIHGIAYDPVTKKIFFTDTIEKSVNWFSFKNKPENNPRGNLLIKVDKGIPRDIVVDSCNGYIYWQNTDMTEPTLERARVDGSERKVFANLSVVADPNNTESKLQSYGLAFDHQTPDIYWIDPKVFLASQLQLTAMKNINETPFNYPKVIPPSNSVTVSNRFIYFLSFNVDNRTCIYEQSKILNFSSIPFNTYVDCLNNTFDLPVGIVANYKLADQIQGRHDCEGLRRKIKIPTECEATFCVYGVKVDGQSVCKCSPGYIGERCDVSVCENYCLQGICSANDVGFPECRCDIGYSGARCNVSVCENYCIHGNCSVNDNGLPECRCDVHYTGVRCEVSPCQNYCLYGNCTVYDNGLPACSCETGYSGWRCETESSQVRLEDRW